jgi:hypothetical protein
MKGRRFGDQITWLHGARSLAIGIFLGYLATITGHFCKIDRKGTVSHKKGSCSCNEGFSGECINETLVPLTLGLAELAFAWSTGRAEAFPLYRPLLEYVIPTNLKGSLESLGNLSYLFIDKTSLLPTWINPGLFLLLSSLYMA